MSGETNSDTTLGVSAGEISVEKSFEEEEFGVPAIKFDIRSTADEPVTVRLIDYIPEDFPMDSVGFHPDFENDKWTAYKDHRVQFERTVDPDEAVTTVYGIRLDDPAEATGFLGAPELYEVDSDGAGESPIEALEEAMATEGDEVDEGTLIDIVPEDGNQVIRDVLAGERETVPGLEDEAEDPLAADDPLADLEASSGDPLSEPEQDEQAVDESAVDSEAEPASDPLADLDSGDEPTDDSVTAADPLADFDEPGGDSEAESDVDSEDEAVDDPFSDLDGPDVDSEGEPDVDSEAESDVDSEAEPESETVSESEPEPVVEPEDEAAVESESGATADPVAESESAPEAEPESVEPGGIGAALATEIREGEISEADLRILRRELDFEQSESTNVRLRHLQSRVDDLAAYTEAMEAFIDEHGTAEQLISGFEDDVEDLREDFAVLESEAGVDDHTLERIDDLEDELEPVGERFDDLEELVGANTDDVTALADEVEMLESDLGSEVEAVAEEVDKVAVQISELQALDDRFDDLEADIERLAEEFDELQEWRSQLSNVFGTQSE